MDMGFLLGKMVEVIEVYNFIIKVNTKMIRNIISVFIMESKVKNMKGTGRGEFKRI